MLRAAQCWGKRVSHDWEKSKCVALVSHLTGTTWWNPSIKTNTEQEKHLHAVYSEKIMKVCGNWGKKRPSWLYNLAPFLSKCWHLVTKVWLDLCVWITWENVCFYVYVMVSYPVLHCLTIRFAVTVSHPLNLNRWGTNISIGLFLLGVQWEI